METDDESVVDFFESASSDEEDFEDDIEIGIDRVNVIDEEEIEPRFGGYEYEFVDEVSPNQKCPVCLLPMKDAVQTSDCGHRFCRDCLQGIMRNDHPVCPNDRREIKEEGGFFADKAWARDILSLRIKCQQSARGCDWIGELRHAEEHQDCCPYEEAECSACQDNIQRRLLVTHLNEECPKRIVECVHCQDEFCFVQKQDHEDIYCRRFPLVCENNCGHEEIPREEMASHVSEKCLMTIVLCPYVEAGCPFQEKRAHLNDHIEANVEDHLEMTWSSLNEMKKQLDTMKDLRYKFQKVQEVNQKMSESFADCHAEIRDLSLAVKNLELENIQQKKLIENMSKKTAREIKSVEDKMLRWRRADSILSNRQQKLPDPQPSYGLPGSSFPHPTRVILKQKDDISDESDTRADSISVANEPQKFPPSSNPLASSFSFRGMPRGIPKQN